MKIAPILGIGLAGAFVGAFVMEIIRRTNPNLVKNIGERTKKKFRMMGEAFREGYEG